jgi:hypothetical protein
MINFINLIKKIIKLILFFSSLKYNIMIDINQVKNQNIYKMIKYILMGLFIFIATKYIPEKILKINEIFIITISSTIVFIILDIVSPSINVNITTQSTN